MGKSQFGSVSALYTVASAKMCYIIGNYTKLFIHADTLRSPIITLQNTLK